MLSTQTTIDQKKLFELLNFAPHPGQQLLFDNEARFKVWVCGRRWGKSLAAARWAEPKILIPGTRGWVVSKTYDLTRKVTREIYQDLIVKMGLNLVVDQQTGPIEFEFSFGSVVEGKTADHPESLLGEGLDWLVFDESAKCKQSVWEYFLRPTLSDRDGECLFISTPNGYNWVYDLYMRGQDPNFPEWCSYTSPSWDNPYLNKADIEEARRTLSAAAFAQEYGGEFTLYAGQVYKEFDERIHVIPEANLRIPTGWKRYRAVDFGYENPFACLWIAVDPEDRVYVYDEYYQRHVTLEGHCSFLVKPTDYSFTNFPRRDIALNNYVPVFDKSDTNYELTIVDISGASQRATMLEHGIPTAATTSEVATGLELVRRKLQLRDDGKPALFVSSRCVNTIKEFNLYSYSETTTKEEPVKEWDHAMDALRYAMIILASGPTRELKAKYF